MNTEIVIYTWQENHANWKKKKKFGSKKYILNDNKPQIAVASFDLTNSLFTSFIEFGGVGNSVPSLQTDNDTATATSIYKIFLFRLPVLTGELQFQLIGPLNSNRNTIFTVIYFCCKPKNTVACSPFMNALALRRVFT